MRCAEYGAKGEIVKKVLILFSVILLLFAWTTQVVADSIIGKTSSKGQLNNANASTEEAWLESLPEVYDVDYINPRFSIRRF